jgi:hypothetical protein
MYIKKFSCICLLSIASFCFSAITLADDDIGITNAPKSGFYIGGQFGKSDLNYSGDTDYLLPVNSVDDKPLGGRGYIGYSFNEFLSLEAGYSYFGSATFTHNPTGNKQDMLTQAGDLLAKGSIPLDFGFGVYLKVGGIWVHRDDLESRSNFFADKPANWTLTVDGAVGLSYNFNPAWSADVAWNKSMKRLDLPSIDFYTIGLRYAFNML